MRNLFKTLVDKTKSTNEIIAEIHNSFDTASEVFLKEAKHILSSEYDIEKGERLKNIGFVSAKKAVEAKEIAATKKQKEELAKAIEYYQVNYPNNKFITEDKVKEICHKYGLLCGDIKHYISDVPEKNLIEIENFKLLEDDMTKVMYWWFTVIYQYNYPSVRSCSKVDKGAIYGHVYHEGRGLVWVEKPESETHHYTKKELKICASLKDFDMKNMRVEDGYKLNLNLPDPIVLQPVKGGYLIVSKWGIEGEDEIVVNQKMN